MIYFKYFLIVLILSSCSSYTKRIDVTTLPEAAVAKLGDEMCTTPCSLEAPENGEYTLLIGKKGFKEHIINKSKPAWQKNPIVTGGAAVISVGMFFVYPDLLAPALFTLLLPPIDDKVEVELQPLSDQ